MRVVVSSVFLEDPVVILNQSLRELGRFNDAPPFFGRHPVFFDLGLIIRARFTILRKRGAQVERLAVWRCQAGLLNSALGCIGQRNLIAVIRRR